VSLASTEFVFIIDAHMRFEDGWLETLLKHLDEDSACIWCTTCVALEADQLDLNKEGVTQYEGATVELINSDVPQCKDGSDKVSREIIEGKWLSPEQKVDWKEGECVHEIACVMGANYATSVEWWNRIGGVMGLQKWGSSEPFLSIKSWLAGGSCKIATDIRVGHIFRDRSPFSTGVWWLYYNKFLIMQVTMPNDLITRLFEEIPNNPDRLAGLVQFNKDSTLIMAIATRFQAIQEITIQDYCNKFKIDYPLED
jgi:hypothetical protein